MAFSFLLFFLTVFYSVLSKFVVKQSDGVETKRGLDVFTRRYFLGGKWAQAACATEPIYQALKRESVSWIKMEWWAAEMKGRFVTCILCQGRVHGVRCCEHWRLGAYS